MAFLRYVDSRGDSTERQAVEMSLCLSLSVPLCYLDRVKLLLSNAGKGEYLLHHSKFAVQFFQVDLAKAARTRGPTGFQLWAFSSLAIAYGFHRVGVCNRERNGEKLAEREARYAMAPILQAEEDRWYVEREKEIYDKEAEIMKNVPGWVVGQSPYFTSRWVPRQTTFLNKNTKK